MITPEIGTYGYEVLALAPTQNLAEFIGQRHLILRSARADAAIDIEGRQWPHISQGARLHRRRNTITKVGSADRVARGVVVVTVEVCVTECRRVNQCRRDCEVIEGCVVPGREDEVLCLLVVRAEREDRDAGRESTRDSLNPETMALAQGLVDPTCDDVQRLCR